MLIVELLVDLVDKHPSIGFWKCYHRLRRQGHPWNHKRVYRVYTKMRLNIRRRAKKRLPARVKQALFQPEKINQVWSVDFMSDSLWDGKRYRLLNIMDDYNREVLGIEAEISMSNVYSVWPVPELKYLCLHKELSEYWRELYLPEENQK